MLDEPFNKKVEVTPKEEGTAETKPDVDVKMETDADVKVEPTGDVKMEATEESEEDQLKRRISWLVIQDLNERFGKWVADRHWLKVRLCVSSLFSCNYESLNSCFALDQLQFFAQLVNLGLVAPSSLTSTLQTFTSALSEEDIPVLRAERFIRAITGALMRAGPGYFEKEKESVEALIVVVHDFAQQRGDGIRAIRDAVFSPRDVVEKRTPERDVRTTISLS